MTPEQLQQLRERFPVGSINTLSADEVHELLAHISTLESELQRVRAERDGLRTALDVDPFCYDVAGDEFCYSCRRERPRLGVYEMRDYQKPEHHDADCQFVAALTPAPAARTEEPL